MAQDPGKLESVLAQAVGDDPVLVAELRAAFLASATQRIAALSMASTGDVWRSEALRLEGLAASFGLTGLLEIAVEAAELAGPNTPMLDRIAEAIAACR